MLAIFNPLLVVSALFGEEWAMGNHVGLGDFYLVYMYFSINYVSLSQLFLGFFQLFVALPPPLSVSLSNLNKVWN